MLSNTFLLQIGHRHVVDASLQEEACCLAQLLVSVNGNNNICAMQKAGPGALDLDSIYEMIEVEMLTITVFRNISCLLLVFPVNWEVSCSKIVLTLLYQANSFCSIIRQMLN